jgi:hypothetical protein
MPFTRTTSTSLLHHLTCLSFPAASSTSCCHAQHTIDTNRRIVLYNVKVWLRQKKHFSGDVRGCQQLAAFGFACGMPSAEVHTHVNASITKPQHQVINTGVCMIHRSAYLHLKLLACIAY